MTTTLSSLLSDCPGLCGKISRHINSVMESEQPGIALSAAISFMGALKSQRVKYVSGDQLLVPNIYTCSLAPTGSGKTTAQHIVQAIIEQAEMSKINMGEPASDSGMLAALQREPRRFLIWDEFGMALSEMSKSSSSYRVAIIRAMTALYSAAGKIYTGKEYAEKDPVSVEKPYLSICAASTPGVFLDAINKSFIESGFLSRWLVFQGESKDVWKDPVESKISKDIIEEVIRIEQGIELKTGGNLAKVLYTEEPQLTFSEPDVLNAIKALARQKLSKSESDVMRAFWTRALEQTLKLCMIFSDDFGVCVAADAVYAWDLVEYLIESIIERCDLDLHDTTQDKIKSRRMEKFINIIPKGKTYTKTEFCKKAFKLGFDKREKESKLIDALENRIFIESVKINEESLKKTTLYSRPE